MLLSELITELQYRVEDDSDNSRFPEDQKINAINNAYYTLLAIVGDKDLHKFRLIRQGITFEPSTSLPYAHWSEETTDPIIRIANAYDKRYNRECEIVSTDILLSKGSNYKYGTMLSTSREYILGIDHFTVYVTPNTTSEVEIWCSASVKSIDVDNQYPITEAIQPIILGMAESELWRSDNDPIRAKEAYAEAINILQAQEGK